ncbi:hypothetical protein LTR24_005524 [Lithohypha guttulata]|uniref:Uncharacterized protein n=1 Tax=Lithohypha guttulata TaxID=1690604 RepID=A0ABR0K911_9EURO|nr:hypothetical protein LTR24_005524 [Lithohypha guttulata]
MAMPDQPSLDRTYPARPLTIAEAIDYTSTRIPPPRTLSNDYNDISTSASQPEPSPFRPGVNLPLPPSRPQARLPCPLPVHLTTRADKLPRVVRLVPLTREILSQITPQQAMNFRWMRVYSSQYFSLMSDGWLGWERAYVDVKAIARDFGRPSGLSIAKTQSWTLRINEDNRPSTQPSARTKAHERDSKEEATNRTDQVEGEEEEEITEAEKISSENSKRVAWYITQRAFFRRG